MTTSRALDRLMAHHLGRPMPFGSTLPLARVAADDRMLVAFVSMGGETSPWGVIWGHPGQAPQVSTTTDPRDRQAVATMLLPFARALLAHLPHPAVRPSSCTAASPEDALQAQVSRRQVWLPGASHREMLHLLHYHQSPGRRPPGATEEATEPEPDDGLRAAFGRACGWLFRESCREGQQRVIDATATLREAYTFPADDAHASHLGFLLAWLTTCGPRDIRRAAALVAEDHPVGTTMQPETERRLLEPRLDELTRLGRGTSSPRHATLAGEIQRVIEGELRRRWVLLEQAVGHLDQDPRPSMAVPAEILRLADYSFSRFWLGECARLRGEPAFEVSPETDGHVAAAFGLLDQERGQDALAQMRLHGDERWQSEAVEAGEAVRGVVRVVDLVGRRPAKGGKKSRRTVWRLEADASTPLRLREGSHLCPAGAPGMSATLQSIRTVGSTRVLEVVLHGGYDTGLTVGLPAADDAGGWTDQTVTLVPTSTDGILMRRGKRLDARQGPGDWIASETPRLPPSHPRSLSEDLLAVVEGLR